MCPASAGPCQQRFGERDIRRSRRREAAFVQGNTIDPRRSGGGWNTGYFGEFRAWNAISESGQREMRRERFVPRFRESRVKAAQRFVDHRGTPSHNTRGEPRSGKNPRPRTTDRMRAAAIGCASAPRTRSSIAPSALPKKCSVRCIRSGRTHETLVCASIASRSPAEMRPTCARVASSTSTAMNNRFPTLLSQPAPHHVERRLRRLKPHHLAPADEVERAHARVDRCRCAPRRRQSPPSPPASPACRPPVRPRQSRRRRHPCRRCAPCRWPSPRPRAR